MSACCLSGTIASGTPKGREETIGGLPTYVAEPADGSKAKTIVVLSDGTASFPLLFLDPHSPPPSPFTFPYIPPVPLPLPYPTTNLPPPPSLRLATPQHAPRRRHLLLCPWLHRLPPRPTLRHLPPRRLSQRRRTPPLSPSQTDHPRQSKKHRHRRRHTRPLAHLPQGGCEQTHHRRLYPASQNDPGN